MAKPPPTRSLPARCLVEFEAGSDNALIAFAVGPDRAVYALHALGAYAPGRPPPAYRVRAWLDGQCLLDTRIDDEPHMLYALQPLGADLLLLSVPPGKPVGAANGKVYSREGRRLRELVLGHGIEHLQTTRKGAIWTAYFDEGVFGDDPVSAHGLAAWDASGESTYRFHPDLAGLDQTEDPDGIADSMSGEITIGFDNQKVTGVNFGYVAPDVPAVEPSLKQRLARTGFDGLIGGAGLGAAVVGGMFLWMRRRRQD